MTRPATKPATALPDLVSELEAINESLESNEEGYIQEPSRSQMKTRRAELAEQIEELENKPHPSESESARRARGLRVLKVRLPEAYLDKLDAICEDSGYSRAEQIMGMIDSETAELAAIRSRQQSKIKRGMRAVGQR